MLDAVKILLLAFLPILFAVTLHEVAHGWTASRLGDQTAQAMGRLTLNPIKHIDAIGTILVPTLLLFFSGLLFGWAKPVPVNWNNLNRPRRDMAIVAIAGPIANLFMLLLWAVLAKITMVTAAAEAAGFTSLLGVCKTSISACASGSGFTALILTMCMIGIIINIMLMILNLLPLLPLDGGRIFAAALPRPVAAQFSRLEPYGLIILLLLLLSGVLWKILLPLITTMEAWVHHLI